MDKIWDRKSFEIGRCGGDEKRNDHAEPKSRMLKKIQKNLTVLLL